MQESIGLYNHGRYFECHQSLEDFYQRSEEKHKPFLEGLVQLAVACRILSDFGEVQGPVRMVRQAIIRLENYQPQYLGVQVGTLIPALEEWTARIECQKSPSPWPEAKPPKIHLRSPLNP